MLGMPPHQHHLNGSHITPSPTHPAQFCVYRTANVFVCLHGGRGSSPCCRLPSHSTLPSHADQQTPIQAAPNSQAADVPQNKSWANGGCIGSQVDQSGLMPHSPQVSQVRYALLDAGGGNASSSKSTCMTQAQQQSRWQMQSLPRSRAGTHPSIRIKVNRGSRRMKQCSLGSARVVGRASCLPPRCRCCVQRASPEAQGAAAAAAAAATPPSAAAWRPSSDPAPAVPLAAGAGVLDACLLATPLLPWQRCAAVAPTPAPWGALGRYRKSSGEELQYQAAELAGLQGGRRPVAKNNPKLQPPEFILFERRTRLRLFGTPPGQHLFEYRSGRHQNSHKSRGDCTLPPILLFMGIMM